MTDPTPPKPNEQDERPKTVGPLALTRQVKDDGRALILYTRRHDHEGGRHEKNLGEENRRDEDRDQAAATGRRP